MTNEEALKILKYRSGWNLSIRDVNALDMAIKALEQQSCYNPDEWCHDCKEYNHDKHCCPRYNKVIRSAVEEMKQPKTGHWINIDETHSKCDRCGAVFEIASKNGEVNYCPHCGERMVEPQESEDKE